MHTRLEALAEIDKIKVSLSAPMRNFDPRPNFSLSGSCLGCIFVFARSGVGITSMGVMRPDLIMRSTLRLQSLCQWCRLSQVFLENCEKITKTRDENLLNF